MPCEPGSFCEECNAEALYNPVFLRHARKAQTDRAGAARRKAARKETVSSPPDPAPITSDDLSPQGTPHLSGDGYLSSLGATANLLLV